MAVIEAPFSRYKRNNYLIIMGILLAAVVIFGYDGYLSRFEWSMRHDFYQMHVIDNGGVPDSDMRFNRYSPPFFLAGAVLLAIRFFMVKGKKLTADETALHIDALAIPYASMESINKTYFDKKGYFTLTYKTTSSRPGRSRCPIGIMTICPNCWIHSSARSVNPMTVQAERKRTG